MNKVAIIFPTGSSKQYFWDSYLNSDPGMPHDIICLHRDFFNIPSCMNNTNGSIYFVNKILDGVDIKHGAFGAYRHGYRLHPEYDYYIFASDDVVIKRDNWIRDIVKVLDAHKMLGFGASQIFNGGNKYPHPSHIRAPFWFCKGSAIKKINWQFYSDHDAEEKIADQFVSKGFFGIQLGNKMNLACDIHEHNHIVQLLHKFIYSDKNLDYKFTKDEIAEWPDILTQYVDRDIRSPFDHINIQNIGLDVQPYDLLIYKPSIEIAQSFIKTEKIKNAFVMAENK